MSDLIESEIHVGLLHVLLGREWEDVRDDDEVDKCWMFEHGYRAFCAKTIEYIWQLPNLVWDEKRDCSMFVVLGIF